MNIFFDRFKKYLFFVILGRLKVGEADFAVWFWWMSLKLSKITQNQYFFNRSKPTFSMGNLWTLQKNWTHSDQFELSKFSRTEKIQVFRGFRPFWCDPKSQKVKIFVISHKICSINIIAGLCTKFELQPTKMSVPNFLGQKKEQIQADFGNT